MEGGAESLEPGRYSPPHVFSREDITQAERGDLFLSQWVRALKQEDCLDLEASLWH